MMELKFYKLDEPFFLYEQWIHFSDSLPYCMQCLITLFYILFDFREVKDDTVEIQYDTYDTDAVLDIHDVLPLGKIELN